MKRIKAITLLLLLSIAISFSVNAQNTVKYKCMVQMNNYLGPGAYIAVYLADKDNVYQKTLYILGDDNKWYPDLKAWHKAFKKKESNISAITAASVSGGDRSIVNLEIESSKMNAGFKIIFESAVEGKDYNQVDVEVPLTKEGLAAKTDGKGYIRYVRFSGK